MQRHGTRFYLSSQHVSFRMFFLQFLKREGMQVRAPASMTAVVGRGCYDDEWYRKSIPCPSRSTWKAFFSCRIRQQVRTKKGLVPDLA